MQLSKTEGKLEEITGTPVTYFAYPFGFMEYQQFYEIKRLLKWRFNVPKEIQSIPLHHQTYDCFGTWNTEE
jgi:hypothetical protein